MQERPLPTPNKAVSTSAAVAALPNDGLTKRASSPNSSVLTQSQPTMGVLKAAAGGDKSTFHVHANTSNISNRPSPQPLGGVLKLVDAPITPIE